MYRSHIQIESSQKHSTTEDKHFSSVFICMSTSRFMSHIAFLQNTGDLGGILD